MYLRQIGAPTVPFGWRARRVPDRDVLAVMPLWLYLLVELWEARFRVFVPLIRLGLWRVREGQVFTSGRWTCPRPIARFLWCFLNDADHAPKNDANLRFVSNAQRAAFVDFAAKMMEQSRHYLVKHVFGNPEPESWAYKAYMKPFRLDG